MAAPPPLPLHTLRTHRAPLSALAFSADNSRLYAGDESGWVSVTDLRARRATGAWRAHKRGVLGLQEWAGGLVSQGRDDLVHIHAPVQHGRPRGWAGAGAVGAITGAAAGPSTGAGTDDGPAVGASTGAPPPAIRQTLHANALNFCRFALVDIPRAARKRGHEAEALLILPNLVDSELADIYHIPSLKRIHTAVNHVAGAKAKDAAATRSGMIMALHLHCVDEAQLRLALGYEDGRVEVWACRDWGGAYDGRREGGEAVWTRRWEGKGHNEAVMAMAVDRTFTRAFTVSADHLLCRYDLRKAEEGSDSDDSGADVITQYATRQIGNASVAVSSDGQVVAVGGWDGRIRLFSAATCKPLGTLAAHRETVQALAFASSPVEQGEAGDSMSATGGGTDAVVVPSAGGETSLQVLELVDDDSDDDSDDDAAGEHDDAPPRARWLASGGKDTKVVLWGLKDFAAR